MTAANSAAHDLDSPIRVLYAASSPADGEFVRAEASAHSPLLSITCATGADETLTCLEAIGPFDAVLIDPQLPDGNVNNLIARIRHRNPRVGIVACVTGDDEALASPALEAGAHAWIPKRRDHLVRLYPVFRQAIDSSRTPGPRQPSAGGNAPGQDLSTDREQERIAREHFEAAIALRDAKLAHEAERARLQDALALQQTEVNRLALELAALRTALDVERQEAETRERTAADAARADREAAAASLARREEARATLARDLAVQDREHASERMRFEAALASRDRDLATLTEELAALRAAPVATLPSPEIHERGRLDARAEAGRLISAVTDDFDWLLSELEQACRRLRTELAEGQTDPNVVNDVDRTMQDGRALTRMLRAFSRREMERARTLDLNETIETMRPMLARMLDADVELGVELAPQLDAVAIDPVQLEVVLVNVVLALRAQLPTGGRVTLVTGRLGSDERREPTEGQRNGVGLTISATRWRREIPIPELASDRWLAPASAASLNLKHLDGLLPAEGSWLDMTGTTPDQMVIRIGLPAA